MCDDESLRSKLWSTGYKISSKRMDQFLDYLVDKDMVEEPYEENNNDDDDDIHNEEINDEEFRTTSDGDMLEHMVNVLEHNMDILTHSIIKHCNKTPIFPKPPHDWLNSTTNQPQKAVANNLTTTIDAAQEQARTRNNKKPIQKSDPVLMYHKMQSIWSKNRVN